jgi:hypothetical protein
MVVSSGYWLTLGLRKLCRDHKFISDDSQAGMSSNLPVEEIMSHLRECPFLREMGVD